MHVYAGWCCSPVAILFIRLARLLFAGTLVATCTHVFFFGDSLNGADGSGGRRCIQGHSSAETHSHGRLRMLRQRRWALAEVEDVLARRFLMHRSAIELLLVTGRQATVASAEILICFVGGEGGVRVGK